MRLPLAFLVAWTASAARGAEPADPFADISVATAPASDGAASNLGLRRELLSQFALSDRAAPSSRQSAGFDAVDKFSSAVKTLGGFDLQGRLVRRDRGAGSLNERDAAMHPGWSFELHNAYVELYDLAGPEGAVNVRAGRFYVPFGLNLQTDTHGTVLQLSNEENFGFERDWYAGLRGALSDSLDYDAYYLAGSGYDLKYRGQSGLGAARVSLANRFASEYGLEGGASFLGGERLPPRDPRPLSTTRAGLDGRLRRGVPTGTLAATTELSGGRDGLDAVFMQLYQLEYLRASRRWGLASQLRRLSKEGREADASVLAEGTWYFRNDVGNADLHWVKVNLERKRSRAVIVTLQYYRYW